jgi:hypothetical protein
MKYFYLSIIALFLCHSAYAASIEDKSLKSLPPEIEKAVRTSGIWYGIAECEFVGMPLILSGDKPHSAYFVTVETKCLGNSAGEIFMVDISGSEPSVIMKGAAHSVQSAKEKHNGLNDLKISMGNAGHAKVEYWMFDGKKFVRDENRSWDFPDCENQKDNPDNPFDCEE